MVYGKVLRSSLAHARIKSIKCAAAEALSGVLTVVTGQNIARYVASPYCGKYLKDQPILTLKKVRYDGDIVAAVAATEEGIAEQAVKLIEVDYEPLPPVTTLDEALAGGDLVHDEQSARVDNPRYAERGAKKEPRFGRGASYIAHEGSNIFHHFRFERGDVEHGFAQADFVFEDTFYFPGAQHCAMEPHASLANFDDDQLTIWSGLQIPFSLRDEIAEIFGIPLNRVRVVVPYVGGGYGGGRGVITSILAALLSRVVRRPVRLAFAGEESFKTFCQPRARVSIKTGVSKDGTFVARQCSVYLTCGAYAHSMPAKVDKLGCQAQGPYRIPHIRTDSYGVYTTTVPTTAFRGFGAPHITFAHESQLDIIASRLQVDPLELRLKNLLEKGEAYNPGDTPLDCDIKNALLRVAQVIEWGKKNDGGSRDAAYVTGKGIACSVKDTGGVNKPAYAMVKIAADGSVLLSSASVELGQGVRTALLQIAAQELGLGAEAIQVTEIDTQYTPYDMGTNSTSGIVVMGQAVAGAARDARRQLIAAATSVLGADEREIVIEQGSIRFGETVFSFQDILRRYFGDTRGEIIGRGFFKVSRNEEAPLGYPTLAWEVGIAGAEVKVDKSTGEVRIAKYVSLGDAGKMINPLQCRGQEEGAVMFGIGHTLFEEILYEDGKLLNPHLVDYRIPKFRDLPADFTSIILEEGGGQGPHGAKGLGEGGVLAVAAAVCNAVYDAIGIRIPQVPLRGERVWLAARKQRLTAGDQDCAVSSPPHVQVT